MHMHLNLIRNLTKHLTTDEGRTQNTGHKTKHNGLAGLLVKYRPRLNDHTQGIPPRSMLKQKGRDGNH